MRPQVIFAANDSMAIGCLFALTEAGLRVPDDIALAGFDDIPTARFMQPPLTTVRVRITDLGGRALDQLIATIANGGAAQQHSVQMLAPELVVRASCGMHSHAAAAPANNPDTVSKKRAQAGPAAQRKPHPAPKHR
ncbi:LacI family transcription regulator [mine drainage metagenome]|uniref:LacI family transcription regulator n=1 Tax=mine drainage metagenome TaxID=410659 RepID=T1CMX4_9ZZZZ